ncbi:DUF92 domain-containing protein [bacterium]|nr:MAG: DUF92 domain-containing protein [bacterium]
MPGLDLLQVAFGALLALIAAGSGYLVRALSRSGAFAAFCLGTIIFGLGGLPWAVLLLAFFIPSSFLSLIFKKRKETIETDYDKGSRRDAWQVLANGGLAGIFAIIHWIFPTAVLPWLGAAAALAAASADTWATELGILSRKDPILITSGKSVAKGTSGGVSPIGGVASLLGASFIATVFLFLFPLGSVSSLVSKAAWMAVAVLISGFLGSLVDSTLGATLQAIYWCPACMKETEKHPLHHCGSQTQWLRGIRWLNNDWVNFMCTLSAVVFVLLFSGII